MSNAKLNELAINGGSKTIEYEFQARSHFGKEEKDAANKIFDKCIETGKATGYNGGEEEIYCREFAEFMGGGYADGVNSGTTAVYVALKALNPEPFTEVIVSPVTDPGGIMPIPLINCIPVVADCAKGSYNTNAQEVKKLISPLTSAIVIAHIGGEPADIENIVRVARKHKIPVIEDCSQSHGAKLNGKMVGSFGDIAAFSTMAGKHHCTGGQGGVVFTKNEDLYWSIRRAADRGKPFGLPAGSRNCVASLNFNLNDLAAAIGSAQLKKLPGIVSRRRAFVAMLIKKGFGRLKSVKIPELLSGAEHSYWWWRIEANTDALRCTKLDFCNALIAEGVKLASDYSAALPFAFEWFKKRNVFGTSQMPWSSPLYKGDSDREFKCPNTFEAIDKCFILSIRESWGEKEADLIFKAFKKVENVYSK